MALVTTAIRHFKKLNNVQQRRNQSILSMKPGQFVDYMKSNNLKRCSVTYDDTSMCSQTSSPKFNELKEFFSVENNKDYQKHEGLFLEIGSRSGALLGAFVWRTNRGQACGGVRLWEYDTMKDYLFDGLRLSQGMGLKSALAGLWAGGGKGVIASPGKDKANDPDFRRNIFLDYGDFLTSLNGAYIGAEDAGVVVSDMDTIFERTRFMTCISEAKGGSGNPSIATGKGIVCAMEATLDFLGQGTLEGKSVVSQGSGNVARVIFDTLLDKDIGQIHATDINEQQLDLTEKMFADKNHGRLILEQVPRGESKTLAMPCDILSPNALGNILNENTIPTIQSKIVCGAANNQLGKLADNKLMMDHGITYVVDFLCNRMGIVNCANETYGRLNDDPALLQHFSKEWPHSIWKVTHEVLSTAKYKGITPVEAAIEIADRESLEIHPIWPYRTKKIIENLVTDDWASA
ncbi:leucine dehydrogenase-like [Clytia hemisphaerica]|uniref:Glutamate/phenylalanine/leucine/valine/L-tryptophan dehydrogenase C-terminal domain-containing protein n=1 Tax=Clytia hemisphaerica TaxID=252671 RepID=A0A7M5V835_9CNID